MIDWTKCNEEDFEIEIQGDEVNQTGASLVFPIKVYHKDGELAFSQGVPIRADFYSQLIKRDHWQEDLMGILKRRIRDEISQRIKTQDISIEHKVDFLKMPRQSL